LIGNKQNKEIIRSLYLFDNPRQASLKITFTVVVGARECTKYNATMVGSEQLGSQRQQLHTIQAQLSITTNNVECINKPKHL